jgi:hypothetical protein
MKLLTKDLLIEYGFTENKIRSNSLITVMSRGTVDVIIKHGECYYSAMGVDLPLRDMAALRKLYKLLKGEELKPNPNSLLDSM